MNDQQTVKKTPYHLSLKGDKGFTLLEMIVAVALFAVVMLISVGALLSLVAASRKAQALHLVVNNLNITLDAMVRSIRMGSNYHCGLGDYTTTQNCATGGTIIAFEPFGGVPSDALDQWVYVFDEDGSVCGEKRICRSQDGGTPFLAITAPTVTIDSMKFYVVGTQRGDTIQPKVVIVLKGTAGAESVRTITTFSVQSTAVQRVLDL